MNNSEDPPLKMASQPNNLFESIFEHSPDCYLLANDNMQYIHVNPAACGYLGYSKEELLKLSILDLTPEMEHHQGQKLWQEFLSKGILEGEYQVVTKTGELLDIEFYAKANIQPGIHLSIIKSNDKKKKIEKELNLTRAIVNEQAESIKKIADNLPGVLSQFKLTLDGQFELPYLSSGALEMYGLSEEELQKNTQLLFKMYPEKDAKLIAEAIQQSAKHLCQFDLEYRIINYNNESKWLRTISTPTQLENGDIVWDGITIDITEKKQMELACINAQKDLNFAQAIAKIGSWKVNLQKRAYSISDELYNILEIDKDTFDIQSVDLLDSNNFHHEKIHPDDLPYVLASLKCYLEEKKFLPLEYRLLFPEKRIKYVVAEGRFQFDDNDNPIYILGTIQDITHLRLLEKELRHYKNRLEEIVEERAKELIQAYVDLEKKNRELLHLTSLMKTILNTTDFLLIFTDSELNILECNDAFAKSCNQDLKSVINSNLLSHIQFEVKELISFPNNHNLKIKKIELNSVKMKFNHFEEFSYYDATIHQIRENNSYNMLFGMVDRTEREIEKKKNQQLEKEIRQISIKIHNTVKNNLESIRYFTSLLLTHNMNQTTRKKLITINSIAQHCSSYIKNILFTIENKNCTLEKLIEEFRLWALMTLKIKDIHFNFELNIENEKIILRPEVTQGILDFYSEVLNNITKHSMADEVEIRLYQYKSIFKLCIKDNGTGFHYEDSEKFELSFGMNILKEIVKEHDGDLTINSIIDKGTEISFMIDLGSL